MPAFGLVNPLSSLQRGIRFLPSTPRQIPRIRFLAQLEPTPRHCPTIAFQRPLEQCSRHSLFRHLECSTGTSWG